MATFYDRLFATNDYLTDGYEMSADYMRPALIAYVWGKMSAAEVKAFVGCTSSGQEGDVQEILDSCPSSLLSTLGAVNRSLWVDRFCVAFVFCRYQSGPSALDSEADFKTALGI